MTAYLIRRLLIALPVLLGITVGTFLLISLAPGDPLLAYANLETLDEARLAESRARLGLDDPLPVRYMRWLGNILQGNLGQSLITQRDVSTEILSRLGNSLRLTALALVFSSVMGVLVGTISAVYQYSALDYALTILSFVGLSVPGFFLALVLVSVFALGLDLFPTSGMSSIRMAADASAVQRFLDQVHHLVLPVLTLSAASIASLARFTRSSMLDVLNADYVRTARGKGVRGRNTVLRHALPNAMLPIITIIALRLPGLFGGSVIVESIFSWPGIGLLTIRAATDKDYPMMMGITLVFAIFVLLANILADVLYAVFDPRVRYDA